MAAPPLLRVLPLLCFRLRLYNHRHPHRILAFSSLCHPSASRPEDVVLPSAREVVGVKDKVDGPKLFDDQNYRKWKDKEVEILRDIEPITLLAKDILHSDRYMDGERLTHDDEKAVVEKLLAYHPRSVDKIGCGLDSIMVDRHPQFRQSRCLFVVRMDGGWIDFSYQKCLREYIRNKYPSHAERFIREHFKRSSG